MPQSQLYVNYFGEVDPERGSRVVEKARDLAWDRDYPVKLYRGELPEGLAWGEDDSQLVVQEGYESRIEVLGKVESSLRSQTKVGLRALFWYVNFHDRYSGFWDKYCKAQTPLRLLTAGMWMFSPFQWPCFVRASGDRKENLELHYQELRRLAHAMGANVVVLTTRGDKEVTRVTVVAGVPAASTNTIEAESLSGIAIRYEPPPDEGAN